MKSASVLFLTAMLSMTGCANPEADARLTALEAKTTELEGKIAALEKQGPRPGKAAAPVDPEKERLASALFREANQANDKLDYATAKTKLAELQEKFPETRSARQSRRLSMDLEIIGKDAGKMEVDKWFQGNTSLTEGKATVVVFWELWCPHCRREVPKIQATFDKYNSQGLNLVAVTKVTKSSTDESIEEFIAEQKLTYPIGKENGTMSQRFGVRGIPAAAVVKDGKIVWRGHPAKINDTMIASWINI